MRLHLEMQEGEEGTLLAYLDKMHYPLWVTQFYENVSKVVEEIVFAAAAAGVKTLELRYVKKLDLRYGENPHQRAAMYSDGSGVGVANALAIRQVQPERQRGVPPQRQVLDAVVAGHVVAGLAAGHETQAQRVALAAVGKQPAIA